MATRTSRNVLSPFEQNPADWTDQQIDEHPLVDLAWEQIPLDQVEEARLIQLEQLRRFHRRGMLPEYAEDADDLELLIEITADPTRFARVCTNWRWAIENPPRRLELPPGCSTYQEAFEIWFADD